MTMQHSSLLKHMKTYHPSGESVERHGCEACDYFGPPEIALKTHMYIHRSKSFNCECCDFATYRNDKLQKHWYEMHSDLPKPFKCEHEG